jgi:hypothetical protein
VPLAQDAPYSDVTYKIIGAALAVYHKIGPGYKEQVWSRGYTFIAAHAHSAS